MNLAACSLLRMTPENRVWYRAIQPQHFSTALATAHTVRIPSRYSPATNTHPAFLIHEVMPFAFAEFTVSTVDLGIGRVGKEDVGGLVGNGG